MSNKERIARIQRKYTDLSNLSLDQKANSEEFSLGRFVAHAELHKIIEEFINGITDELVE